MKCHKKDDGYFTVNQWNKKGFTKKDNVDTRILWRNRFCDSKAEFYKEDEVRAMTKTELEEYHQKIKLQNHQKYEARRKKQLEEKNNVEIYQKAAVEKTNIYNINSDIDPKKMIVFDVETTGLSFNKDEILQLSICDGNGEILMNQYFKPERCISWSDAERINSISPEMVRDMPYIKDFIVDIQKIVDNAELLITYNGVFDRTFLSAVGIEFHGKPEVDVMLEFAEIYGEWSDYYMGNKWQKLTTAATYYGFSYDGVNAHDSSVDVLATLFVLEEMIKEIKPKTLAR